MTEGGKEICQGVKKISDYGHFGVADCGNGLGGFLYRFRVRPACQPVS